MGGVSVVIPTESYVLAEYIDRDGPYGHHTYTASRPIRYVYASGDVGNFGWVVGVGIFGYQTPEFNREMTVDGDRIVAAWASASGSWYSTYKFTVNGNTISTTYFTDYDHQRYHKYPSNINYKIVIWY